MREEAGVACSAFFRLMIARAAIDGVEAGAHEVPADDVTRWAKAGLSGDLYPQLAR